MFFLFFCFFFHFYNFSHNVDFPSTHDIDIIVLLSFGHRLQNITVLIFCQSYLYILNVYHYPPSPESHSDNYGDVIGLFLVYTSYI